MTDYMPSGSAATQMPWQSGRYYWLPNYANASTDNTLGTGTARFWQFWVPNDLTVSRLGGEITSAGDAGSLLRLGIYQDDGTGRPGTLVIDAGTIAGDSVAVQEITVNQPLPAGAYWGVAVVQSVTTTQPTVRTAGNPGLIPVDSLTTIPTAGATTAGFSQTGVTGALPGTASVTGISGKLPRAFAKVA